MNTRPLALLSAVTLALLPTRSVAVQPPITWGTPTLISADTDVSTTDSLLYAYTLGGPLVPAATVNGVLFAPFAVPTGTTTISVGSVTLSVGSGNLFFSANGPAGSSNAPFTTLSPAYQGLLKSAVTDFTGGLVTLTLGGLTNGQSYRVQFWSNDASAALTGQPNSRTVLTAGNAVTLDNNSTDANGGVGQWVTGTFTAASTTEVVTIQAANNQDDVAILNAFQVRAVVPEPGSALLLAAGAGLLLRRRRG